MKVLKVLTTLGFEKRTPHVKGTLEYTKVYKGKEGKAGRTTVILDTDKETGMVPERVSSVVITTQRSMRATAQEIGERGPAFCRQDLLRVLSSFEDESQERHVEQYKCEECGALTPETIEGRCVACTS